MNVKELLNNIKTIFLFALTTLVIINTYVLAYLVPTIGSHIMPDNQAATELWEVVTLIMGGCIGAIIICGIMYGTIKIIKKGKRND